MLTQDATASDDITPPPSATVPSWNDHAGGGFQAAYPLLQGEGDQTKFGGAVILSAAGAAFAKQTSAIVWRIIAAQAVATAFVVTAPPLRGPPLPMGEDSRHKLVT